MADDCVFFFIRSRVSEVVFEVENYMTMFVQVEDIVFPYEFED